MNIRPYQKEDCEAVWELHKLVVQSVAKVDTDAHWDSDLHAIEETYIGSGGAFLVGEADGRIVAMGALLVHSPVDVEVKRMRVHPEYQRRGFGK